MEKIIFGAMIGSLIASLFWVILWSGAEQAPLRECAQQHNVFTCEKVFVPTGRQP